MPISGVTEGCQQARDIIFAGGWLLGDSGYPLYVYVLTSGGTTAYKALGEITNQVPPPLPSHAHAHTHAYIYVVVLKCVLKCG